MLKIDMIAFLLLMRNKKCAKKSHKNRHFKARKHWLKLTNINFKKHKKKSNSFTNKEKQILQSTQY